MSKYRFVLENYHAVRKADIEIDGITVLAGPNGCGKSTVARWLDFCVSTLTGYDDFADRCFRDDVRKLMFSIERFLRGFGHPGSADRRELFIQIDSLSSIKQATQLTEHSRAVIDSTMDYIGSQIAENGDEYVITRLRRYFGVEVQDGEDAWGFIDRLTDTLNGKLDKALAEHANLVNDQSEENFTKALATKVNPLVDDFEIDCGIDFYEDGADLLGKQFSIPLMLDRSIYLNTQSLGRALETQNGRLADMLNEPNEEVSEGAKLVAKVIQRIINGRVDEEKEDIRLSMQKRLQYVRYDGMRIYLQGAATGIISFSYLLRLLDNGWIDNRTLLIIDEPEAHLHPQWVVDYARVLVLICKEVGSRIVVSSHSPDMLSAIQAISRKEGMLEDVHFYIAEREHQKSDRYIFKNLGEDVGLVFDSFNKAFDKIAIYGTEE